MTGVLTARFDAFDEAAALALRSPDDLAGVTPQRPKTHPPAFFALPSVDPDEEIDLASLLGGARMLERKCAVLLCP